MNINFRQLLAKQILTSLLSTSIILLILTMIIFPVGNKVVEKVNAQDVVKEPLIERNIDDAGKTDNLILAFPYKLDAPIIKIPNPLNQTEAKVSNVKVITTKPKTVSPSKTPSPTPSVSPIATEIIKVPDEIVSSTVETRDLERLGIVELLSDRISEYSFLYNSYPILYSNKSKTLLKDIASHSVFLYEDEKNKTNALSLEIGTDSYLLQEVTDCSVTSTDNLIKFTYSSSEIVLCTEAGRTMSSSIFQIAN